MNLAELLKLKFPEASSIDDYQVGDKGDGVQFISYWGLDAPQPTEEDLRVWREELDLEFRINKVREQRKLMYPSLEEQLDMQYHDIKNNTNKWLEKIEEIKQQYPIPKE